MHGVPLLSQAELFDEGAVALEVGRLQVAQQAPALTDDGAIDDPTITYAAC
jgi:hypothetical protein